MERAEGRRQRAEVLAVIARLPPGLLPSALCLLTSNDSLHDRLRPRRRRALAALPRRHHGEEREPPLSRDLGAPSRVPLGARVARALDRLGGLLAREARHLHPGAA